jgi:hypothetical protein
MRRVTPSPPNTPSWRSAQLKKAQGQLYLCSLLLPSAFQFRAIAFPGATESKIDECILFVSIIIIIIIIIMANGPKNGGG